MSKTWEQKGKGHLSLARPRVKDTALYHLKLELGKEPHKEIHKEAHLGKKDKIAIRNFYIQIMKTIL